MFRNDGPLRDYETWKFDHTVLEVVPYYKYLGILFSSRNSWFVDKKKTLAQQAAKKMYVVKSKLSRFGDINSGILFKNFDSKILPILLYGSEVWCSYTSPEIGKIHNQFHKYVLRLPLYATNAFVRSELGRYKIDVFKKLRAIKYWLRIIALHENRYPKLCYKMQVRWVANNTDCWLLQKAVILVWFW